MAIDRLAMLRQLAERSPGDPFPQYGLAMELRKRGAHDEAVAAFEQLATRHPAYVPGYLMYGNLLRELARTDDARAVYDRGIAAAQQAGDSHAQGELESARAELS
jgi:tetratricopeptide (TPR) repeat protein